jgi:hypothetical protein
MQAPIEMPTLSPSSAPEPRRLVWQNYIDGINHEQLLAVDDKIYSITSTLMNPSAGWVMTVSGEGGMGKTAVTFEAVKSLAETDEFTRIVWASAKSSGFEEDAVRQRIETVYWEDVVAAIAEQLDCRLRHSQDLWEEDLRRHVAKIGKEERILLIVDNLEGIRDVERVIDRIRSLGLGQPHKLIATTRWRLRSNDSRAQDVAIPALARQDSLELVRLIGKNNAEISSASDRTLNPIYQITEGNPYLIRLIVKRYVASGLALERIISGMASLQTNDGRQVRSYLFAQSLEELARQFDPNSAARLIASFCVKYPRGASLTFEQLRDGSQITDSAALQELIEAACRLSLIRPSDRNRRYSIHSLLYEYTVSGK